jgi:uncharacterized protein (TIGR03382 family)
MRGLNLIARPVADAGRLASATALKIEVQMSNALALVRWHGFRFLHGSTQNSVIFWVLAGMAALALFAWAIQRRRRRWF